MIRAAIAAILLASPAVAQDTMRTQERVRLDAYHDHAGRGLLEAMSGGTLGNIDLLQEALDGVPLAPLATTLAGDWDCRTMKLGGISALSVYAPFKCRFTPDGPNFIFEKLTGSQRTLGQVTLENRTMIYLGVGFVADAEPVAYADLPPEDTGDGKIKPQVAVIEQVSPTAARMMFPAPINESLFDVLYLTRSLPTD